MWQLFYKSEPPVAVYSGEVQPVYSGGVWDCGQVRFTDAEGILYEPVFNEDELPITLVTPIQFKMLFTPLERVAIKASEDPVVQDFFSLVEDPRLTAVDRNLQSVENALRYLEALSLIDPGRADQILVAQVN